MNYTNLELIKDIWHFLKPYKKRFFIGSFLRLTSDIVWLFPPWAISEIINFAADYQKGASLEYFWILMISIWSVALYHLITHDLAKFIVYPIGERMMLDAILETNRHMFELDSEWHEKENSGNKIKRMNRGAESLDSMIRLYIDLVIESTVNIIGIIIVLSALGPTVDLLLIFFFITYFLISLVLTKKAGKQSHIANIKWEEFDGLDFEAVNNISTIKSLGISRSIMHILRNCGERLYKEVKKRIFWFRTRSAVLNLYREIFRQILIFYVVWNVFQGNLEVGTIALALLYFEKISSSASEFSEFSNEFVLSRIAMMRLKDILKIEPKTELSGIHKFNQHWKTIETKNLTFGYSGRKILNNLNLTIKRGEKVGIVGISGTGKSTLFKLLLKLYENYEGDIFFDDQTLRDTIRKSYLESVSYVPQETELFNFSLRENIILSDPNAFRRAQSASAQKSQKIGSRGSQISEISSLTNNQRFEKAIEIAHVSDFLHKLPEGVDSLIGEKGIKLSGGERQRVGIARAIYKSPEILFMDEATSHLDVESEKKIQEALHLFFKGITALVIAHRLSTLKEMDRIIVMSNGEVIEHGSFKELIKLEGKFYQLWKKQKF